MSRLLVYVVATAILFVMTYGHRQVEKLSPLLGFWYLSAIGILICTVGSGALAYLASATEDIAAPLYWGLTGALALFGVSNAVLMVVSVCKERKRKDCTMQS